MRALAKWEDIRACFGVFRGQLFCFENEEHVLQKEDILIELNFQRRKNFFMKAEAYLKGRRR